MCTDAHLKKPPPAIEGIYLFWPQEEVSCQAKMHEPRIVFTLEMGLLP
jgi:hypothetical protein